MQRIYQPTIACAQRRSGKTRDAERSCQSTRAVAACTDGHPQLRQQGVIGVSILIITAAVFYFEENWRGRTQGVLKSSNFVPANLIPGCRRVYRGRVYLSDVIGFRQTDSGQTIRHALNKSAKLNGGFNPGPSCSC